MNNREESGLQDGHEENTMAQLLQLAGPRPDAPPERAARVRETVYRQWQRSRRRRAVRRGAVVTTGLLAAAAALVLTIRLVVPRQPASPPLGDIVATAERIEGAPVLRRQADDPSRRLRVSLSSALRADDIIETDDASRAALRTADGSSVRLDRGSRARLISPTVIELVQGAVFVATSERSNGFEVRTGLATVLDRGTQFEVRLDETSLRLRVREGLVEIRRGDAVIPARAGTEATVTSTGVDTRSVAIYGSDWEWAATLGPSFDIEGRPLAAFLDHAAREQGWTLRYADASLATAASSIVLHGSVEGLRAEEALAVALATSGLQYRLRDGELLVFKPADAR